MRKNHNSFIPAVNLRKHVRLRWFLSMLIILCTFQITLDWAFDRQERNSVIEGNNMAMAHKDDYCIYIEISDKTLYLLKNGTPLKEFPIATGMSGLPSPLGSWNIIEKGDWGEGFGGRWLGLDVPCPA